MFPWTMNENCGLWPGVNGLFEKGHFLLFLPPLVEPSCFGFGRLGVAVVIVEVEVDGEVSEELVDERTRCVVAAAKAVIPSLSTFVTLVGSNMEASGTEAERRFGRLTHLKRLFRIRSFPPGLC